MATENFRNEKQAVLTFTGPFSAIHWREYLKRIWTDVTEGLHSNIKITVIAGVHGGDDGLIGEGCENIATCQKQLEKLEEFEKEKAFEVPRQVEGSVLDIREFLDENQHLNWKSLYMGRKGRPSNSKRNCR